MQAARNLRAEGRILDSYKLVQGKIGEGLVWQHQPVFWQEIAAGNCLLTRRNGPDAAFIRQLWSEQDFAYRFNRTAAKIPQQQADLERILKSEYVSLLSDLNSLHWVVRDSQREPWGVLSLTNVSLAHQRAEVLGGLRKGAPFGMGAAAMLLLFRFWFGVLRFRKLYALTFDGNEHSLRSALHLGFKVEGRLRQHCLDPVTRTFVDVVQAGLLAEDAFSASNERLMRRLQFN